MKHPIVIASYAITTKAALTVFGIASVTGAAGLISARVPPSMAPPAPAQTASLASADRIVASEMLRPDGFTSVIVRLSSRNGCLAPRQRAELAALDAKIIHELPIIRSVALRLPRRSLRRLASASWALRLSSDSDVQKTDEFTTVASGAAAAFTQYGVTGSGVTVAVLDSGIDPAEDLRSLSSSASGDGTRISVTRDFIDDGNTTPKDASGHGTHVAGVIAGNGAMSTGKDYFRTFVGVARNAKVVNVRVLDELGSGEVSDVIAGLQWVIQNKSVYNIRVVNLSLGHTVGESFTTDPLCLAVEQAWKAGIVVVCAAGNDGRASTMKVKGLAENGGYGTQYGSIRSPANSPYVITVGAARRQMMGIAAYASNLRAGDQIASYSGRGPSSGDLVLKPDLMAPGDRVISLQANGGYLFDQVKQNQIKLNVYQNKGGKATSDQYLVLSGTSIAAPVVAGAAALMIQRDPTLTPDTIKARLMLTADKWVGTDGKPDPFTYGAGYVNIAAALQSTITVQGFALSPFVSLESAGGLRIGDHTSVWQNGTFWGTGITDLSTIWGSSVYASDIVNDQKNLRGRVYEVGSDAVLWGNGTIKRTTDLLNATTVGGDH